ncbi:D-alanyl-lipoteichoic acid biosynthesis protein DltD [Staphylococcus arlettae]|uniref:D-alanyl-lipoteichoic acid biosynthesis protein DltD n=2 Tax=Staphylococcus arlettae TaxID=29378 RepID=UPI00113A8C42|nr:D-alanyl-lipoteichoic acid biosynthesis protein DltD [Staphylococcus arlettae]MCD9054188.1 D-alanyl-lipoteichoic acid biosynthesis protein DltD [Staphylococcus arlettae]MCP8714295.1 D-alanyl-lipoteichoic acid biosynthesis protein DltD [Staphylococcus arlettae]MDN0188448.1 D-alanyl-lipoteichoic acid biosynthesis protein DltD [Staphylococcus arlettae]BBK28694.1 D-alanyl-lipoteichoic acid biosynthesis protein DltD [Staphylococcus arlettae]
MKQFYPFIISLVLFGIFVALPTNWFKGLISNQTLSEQRNLLSEQVLKGTLLQNKLYETNNYYPIYGSSELGKQDPFHPAVMLTHRVKKPPFLVGTGGSTDLINAVTLAANFDQLNGKKLTFIISPQWFTQRGLTRENFNARISETQIAQLFKQQQMSKHLKERYAQRLLQFKDVKNKPFLHDMSRNKQQSSHAYVSSFKENQLLKIEAIKAAFPLNKQAFKHVGEDTSHRSWTSLKAEAELYGQQHSMSNQYNIQDKYWQLIQAKQRKFKRNHEFKVHSPEFEDLALLVDTLKAAGADVQYIVIPTNGKWYDHIGIKSKQRQMIYQKIKDTITAKDGKLYDMTSKDYEPYVISDAVHIGWKGWVYVNEQIVLHQNQ